MLDPTISFGAWVRQRRRMLDLTQTALAEQINCAVITIKKIESDQRRPSISVAEQLATILRIPSEEQAIFIQVARGQLPLARLPSSSLMPQPESRLQHAVLPLAPYPMIGRVHEIRLLLQLLQRGQRLITIYGPPGIGKTRILQELGQQLRYSWKHPIQYLDLTPVQSPAQIPYVLQRLLGIDEQESTKILERLMTVFQEQPYILLIDNFEHVVDAATLLATLLSTCPDLTIVVTSRITLRLRAEHIIRLEPLPIQHAIHLLLMRARAFQQQYYLPASVEQQELLRALVQHLDCLPLAIELAAARLDTYSLHELLHALRQRTNARMQLLTNGARDLPAHQQTMYAAIAWSYQLLPEPLQHIFRQLSVFRDGWNLGAAQAVTGCSEAAIGMLVRHSLIVRNEYGAQSRFRLLELIREYAHEQLMSVGEEATTNEQHANYFRALIEHTAPITLGSEQVLAIEQLTLEHANIDLALTWFAHKDITIAIELILALGPFWMRSGQYQTGILWTQQVQPWAEVNSPIDHLALCIQLAEFQRAIGLQAQATNMLHAIMLLPDNDQYQRLRALAICHIEQDAVDPEEFRQKVNHSIAFFRHTGDIRGLCMALLARSRHIYHVAYGYATPDHFAQCRNDAIEAEQHARQLCDLSLLASVITWRSFVESRCIRLIEARSFQEEAIAIFRRLGYTSELAWGLRNLGMILGHMGNCEAACQPLNESIQLMRQLHMSTGLAWTIYELGRAYARCGNDQQAIPLLQEGLALARSIHEGTGMACSHHWLGRMALKQAQLHATTEHFCHSIDLFYRADNRNGVLEVLPSIAEYLGQIGQPEQAACLLAAASNLRQQLALPAQPIEIEEAQAIEEGIRFRMSTTEFCAATMRGTQLSYEQAYALARNLFG